MTESQADSSSTADAVEQSPPTTEEFLTSIATALGPHYRIISDGSFHWATPFPDEEHRRYAAQATYALRRVEQTIAGLVVTPPGQGWPAILFDTREAQLSYDELFGGSGATLFNGGCWRNWPVGHLAIPVSAWDALDAAFGHELVHAALSGTGVPTWLQEGLATELETGMGNRKAPLSDLREWRETLTWWRTHPAENFWDSSAFHAPESSRHAYALAQVMALGLTQQPTRLRLACTIGPQAWAADEDGVLRQVLGGDRTRLIDAVIGEGRQRGWVERFLYWCFVGDRP